MRKNILAGKWKALTWVVISFFCAIQGVAQQTSRMIEGNITSSVTGSPIIGATVTIKSNRKAVTTNENGTYTILAKTGETLVVSFVGYKTKEATVTDGVNKINFQLSEDFSHLQDIVVIGYGTQKKEDVNGAISSVTAAQIANIPQPTVDQMLQGKAAGVTVTANSGQPGSAISVHIRGITSFSGSEPLYVIDGVAIDGNAPSQASTNDGIFGGLSPVIQEQKPSVLASLNPNDIASIDILKDASATAIYGSRGANGVVIITTKKGKAGNSKISYNGWYGVQEQGKFLDMMNLPQYAAYENKLANLFGQTPRVEFADPSKLGPGTNWQDAIFRRASETSHSLSFSGSNAKTDYYLSAGYFQQDGTIISSNFNRYSFHASVNSQVKEWFKVGTSVSANQNKANTVLGNNYGIIYSALLQAPDVPVYNA